MPDPIWLWNFCLLWLTVGQVPGHGNAVEHSDLRRLLSAYIDGCASGFSAQHETGRRKDARLARGIASSSRQNTNRRLIDCRVH